MAETDEMSDGSGPLVSVDGVRHRGGTHSEASEWARWLLGAGNDPQLSFIHSGDRKSGEES